MDIRGDIGIWKKIDHFLKGKMGTKIQNALFQPISNRFLHFKNSFLWFPNILNTFLQGRTHIRRQIPKLAGLSLRSWKGPTSSWPYRKIKLATLKICLCHLVGLDFLGEWVLTLGKNPRRPSALFAWWKPPENLFKTPHPRYLYLKKFANSTFKNQELFCLFGFTGRSWYQNVGNFMEQLGKI